MIKIVSLFSLVLLIGCQTSPTRYDKVSEGQWDGRILIKDKRKNRSHIVDVDINSVKGEKIRLDVTAALGTPVAVLVVDGDKTEYILFKQKAYYEGKTQPKVLRPILALDMDPRLLYSLLFEKDLTGKTWKCERDKKDFLKSCSSEAQNLTIAWTERRGERKTIKITHPNAELQLNVNNFKPKVAEKAELFDLDPPKGFKTYSIR